MTRTILLGIDNKFSSQFNKWLFRIIGLLFSVIGIHDLYSYTSKTNLILGVLIIVIGIYYSVYGLIGFSKKSKHAPKIKVNKTTIAIKNGLWKGNDKLEWADVHSIHFSTYNITFQLKNNSYSFVYISNSDVSIKIKQTIREFALDKNIQVIGG